MNTVKFWLFGLMAAGVLMYALMRRGKRTQSQRHISVRVGVIDVVFAVLTTLVFMGMVFQGGLLDFLADGWWHLAYVSQIISDNSLFITKHPTVGGETVSVIYPPLWHLQLALISEASSISPAILWHFVAPINVVFLLLAFYQLTVELTRSKKIALLAVVLHIFLIGGLISYFRVSSWPGNVSYIALYFGLALVFRLSTMPRNVHDRVESNRSCLREKSYCYFLLATSIFLMVGLHGVEAALFLLALFSVWICTGLFYSPAQMPLHIDADLKHIRLFIGLMSLAGFILALTIFKSRYLFLINSPPAYEPYLSLIIPVGILIYVASYQWIMRFFVGSEKKQIIKVAYFIMLGLMLTGILDWQHAVELFFPISDPIGRHVPRDFQGKWGNWLFLPFWEHQLRGGMLFSGVLGMLVGFILVFVEKNRATLFIFSTTSLVFLVLLSPYFFTLTAFVIPLASVYRVSLLLFTPLVLAVGLSMLLTKNSVES
ncbi:hypothetical protein OAI08_03745 [Gammaproteobacteria bacterium]|nr:hypothetical protein [Gammaproteobacteria bacterium]